MADLPSRQALKRELLQRGFEPYRTLADAIVLADRVRENLILDSGVAAGVGESLFVRVVVRAEGLAFPGESPAELLARARALGAPLLARGYSETAVEAVPIPDPGDRSETLDTWHEVTFLRSVASLEELFAELGATLPMEKSARPGHRA